MATDVFSLPLAVRISDAISDPSNVRTVTYEWLNREIWDGILERMVMIEKEAFARTHNATKRLRE